MKKMTAVHVYKGDIVFTPSPRGFQVHEDSYIVVADGKVKGIYYNLPEPFRDTPLTDYGNKLIVPGFVDLHVHAPQFFQRGMGLDEELLSWLNNYTYPIESLFADPVFAHEAYSSFVKEMLYQGTLHACIFATVHLESSKILIELLKNKEVNAYVGKVNMDQNCPDFLKENTETSISETYELIETYCKKPNGTASVKPIITPRFAPTASTKMLEALGTLAADYHLPVQSHLSETEEEIKWVKEVHPDYTTYADVYYHNGLFGQTPTLMAHGIHLTEGEQNLAREMDVKLVHCPDSNINLSSGIMPVRSYLESGIRVGLGSDVGAGHTLFMPRAMISAIQVSKMVALAVSPVRVLNNTGINRDSVPANPLTLAEAFYMGTKEGGSYFGKVGSFEEDYSFDALVVAEEPAMTTKYFSPLERLQRFLYSGSAKNIVDRFIGGRKINT